MNNLEQFIRSNREEFDSKEPREKLWERVETGLDSGRVDYGWMWKAAVVVLLAVSGYLVWERSQDQAIESMVASEFFLDPEFMETELYYTQLIAQKRLVVVEFDLEDQEIKEGFKKDIALLDTMYQELKQEFIDTNNEAVLDAMISNLQVRMELLNQQLMILETIEKHDNEKTNETQYL
jgi:hypothetical protein